VRPWAGRWRQDLTRECLYVKGTRCHLCGGSGADTADHVIPRTLGGRDALSNLEPAHQSCNSARGSMLLADWFATHPLPTRPTLAPSREW